MKRVRFAETETIHVLPAYRNNDEDDGDDDIEDIAKTDVSSTGRTSQLTVLSSQHGRARRELREITVFDLQSAIKYGVKTSAYACRRTGMPRWKYTYANVVYITDYSSTREITSYKQPIDIQPASISSSMMDQHQKDLAAIKKDPLMCATYSIIVIDQSGSMKASDVAGFRNRSQAAYGTLALEYIAEQLHQREEQDGVLDAISVVEMNESSTLTFDQQPLDWIFFNKVLDRQKVAVPKSHGNYNPSLYIIQRMIESLIVQTGVSDEDIDDLPAISVVFLSDGKPSDKNPLDEYSRELALSHLGSKLKSNFTFTSIGLGQSNADFSALSRMAKTVTSSGGNGSFMFAELSSAALTTAMSSASTTLTATRTAKLGASGKDNPDHPSQKKRDVQCRSKSVPESQRRYSAYTYRVSRWKFDDRKFAQENVWPWLKLPFKNNGAVGFDMETEPFGKGAERLAYMFYEINKNKTRLGKKLVAKESISVDSEEKKVNFHQTFCRVQRKALDWSTEFNKAVAKTPSLRPTVAGMKTPEITFLKCFVYDFIDDNGTQCGLLVEDYLKGRFIKYNGNHGYTCNRSKSATMDLQCGEVHLTDFVQALSHWTYFVTNQSYLLCDLQGVLNGEGRHQKFILTDPCICSKKGKRFGKSDMRRKGFRAFRKSHRCSPVCRSLGLPPF